MLMSQLKVEEEFISVWINITDYFYFSISLNLYFGQIFFIHLLESASNDL